MKIIRNLKMKTEMSGLEILREAERIVAAFHAAAVKQNESSRHTDDMATCCRVLRGLITVGESLKESQS
jgi:hypothetical protein